MTPSNPTFPIAEQYSSEGALSDIQEGMKLMRAEYERRLPKYLRDRLHQHHEHRRNLDIEKYKTVRSRVDRGDVFSALPNFADEERSVGLARLMPFLMRSPAALGELVYSNDGYTRHQARRFVFDAGFQLTLDQRKRLAEIISYVNAFVRDQMTRSDRSGERLIEAIHATMEMDLIGKAVGSGLTTRELARDPEFLRAKLALRGENIDSAADAVSVPSVEIVLNCV